MNLKELGLVGNQMELLEEQTLTTYDYTQTATNVMAYFERRFGMPRSLLRLCHTLRGFIGIQPPSPKEGGCLPGPLVLFPSHLNEKVEKVMLGHQSKPR